MPKPLIQNQGISETVINDNKKVVNRTNWAANYDGDNANILVDTNTNGRHNVYNIKLDNDDLATLLNIPSVDTNIYRRLVQDFKKTNKIKNRAPTPYMIEFDNPAFSPMSHASSLMTHVSSPSPNQELIAYPPQDLGNKTHRRYKKRRKHTSYKLNRRTKRYYVNPHRKTRKHLRQST